MKKRKKGRSMIAVLLSVLLIVGMVIPKNSEGKMQTITEEEITEKNKLLQPVMDSSAFTGARQRQKMYNFASDEDKSKEEGKQKKSLSQIDKTLPETYDLRNVDGKSYSTSTKNQGIWRSCWAYGTIASLESNLLKKMGGQAVNGQDQVDLSEKQLAWFAFYPVTENYNSQQATEGTHLSTITGKDILDNTIYDVGGNDFYSAAILSDWMGIATEADIPYMDKDGKTTNDKGDWTLSDDQRSDQHVSVHLQDVDYLPISNTTDEEGNYKYDASATTAMKNAIYQNGALAIGYAADQSENNEELNGDYFNYKNGAQYTSEQKEATHEVTIVGWDDGYDKSNFICEKSSEGAPADGAWLVKNSWGINRWGLFKKNSSGYHYLHILDGIYKDKYIQRGSNGITTRRITETMDEDEPGILSDISLSVDADNDYLYHFFDQDGNELGTAELVKENPESPTWDGYFYLSYYDQSLVSCASYQGTQKGSEEDYDHNYQYDYAGNSLDSAIEKYGETISSKEVSIANVFTANGYESLYAVSTTTISPASSVTVNVYTFPVGTKVTEPTKGTLVSTITKTIDYAGYHTISLPESVNLKPNQSFAIVETNEFVQNESSKYYAPIEKGSRVLALNENDSYVYVNTICNTGESYIGTNGKWYDISNKSSIQASTDRVVNELTYKDSDDENSYDVKTVGNAMIKAFTTDRSAKPGETETENPVTVTSAPVSTLTVSTPTPTPTSTPTQVEKTKLTISGSSHKVAFGKKVSLKANKSVSWSSSKKAYATVSSGGVVSTKKAGKGKTVLITAVARDGTGVKTTYKIKIMKGIVKKIKITGSSQIKSKDSTQLKVKIKASKGAYKAVKWVSGNSNFATVSQSGIVKAKKSGQGRTITIRAIALDGSKKADTHKIRIY